MLKLKQVVHYEDTNSVEATWVDEITPAIEVAEVVMPDVVDAEGVVTPGEDTPARTTPAVEVQVKCHSYADSQMYMLRSDLGADAAEHEDLMALVESRVVPAPPPTAEQIIKSFTDAIQNHLDSAARDKNYDDIVSACSYAGYTNAFQAEGVSFGQWRAACWQYCYAELDKVQTGTRPMPTIDEIIAELPVRVIP